METTNVKDTKKGSSAWAAVGVIAGLAVFVLGVYLGFGGGSHALAGGCIMGGSMLVHTYSKEM